MSNSPIDLEKIKANNITVSWTTLIFIISVAVSGTKFYIQLDTIEHRIDKRYERVMHDIEDLKKKLKDANKCKD